MNKNTLLIWLFLCNSLLLTSQNLCTLICKDTTLRLDQRGSAMLTPSMIAQAYLCEADSLQVSLLSLSDNTILPFAKTHLLTCDNLGRFGYFNVRVAEIKNGVVEVSCHTRIKITDPHNSCPKPSIECIVQGAVCDENVVVSLDAQGQYLLDANTGYNGSDTSCIKYINVSVLSHEMEEILPTQKKHVLNCDYVGHFIIKNSIQYDSSFHNDCYYHIFIKDSINVCPPTVSCDLTCKEPHSVSIGFNTEAVITADSLLLGSDYLQCKEDIRLKLFSTTNEPLSQYQVDQTFRCEDQGTYIIQATIIKNGIEGNSCFTTVEINDGNLVCASSFPCTMICQDRTVNLDDQGTYDLYWNSFGLQLSCQTDSIQVKVDDLQGNSILPYARHHVLGCSYKGKYKVSMREIVNGVLGTHCTSTLTITDTDNYCQECDFTFCDFEVDVNLDENGQGYINWDTALLPNSFTGDCEESFYVRLYSIENEIFPYGRYHPIDCSLIGEYYLGTTIKKDNNFLPECFTKLHIKDTHAACKVADEHTGIEIQSTYVGPYAKSILLNGNPLNKIHYSLYEMPNAAINLSNNSLQFDGKGRTMNGVDIADVVLIQSYLVEDLKPSPLESILSDFDNSGYIDLNDIIQVRKAIVGIDSIENRFIFLKDDIQFATNFDPFDFGKEIYSFTFDKGTVTNFKFNAYMHGDVNQSGYLQTEIASENRNKSYMLYDEVKLLKGQNHTVKFSIDNFNPIAGMQVGINVKDAKIIGFLADNDPQNYMYNLKDGKLYLSYLALSNENKLEFSIQLIANESGLLSDYITIDNNVKPIFVTKDREVTPFELKAQSISSTDNIVTNEVKAIPNPSDGNTKIILDSDIPHEINLYGIDGKLVKTFSIKGGSFDFTANMFPQKGLYIVQIKNKVQNNIVKLFID